ncbi:hypothetical protein F2Q68_00046137 [Brassica cretica]|uniref:Uncharacterized protein n=1 Tax=Brassica cretica TaxID=69181 RepID=A0A8S9LIU1_BRACR|nr:hypothetical protein F2Q68_00046137 [Brassica cretica]
MPTTGTPSTGMPNSGTPANGMPTSSSSSVFPGTTLGPTGSGGFGDPNAGEKISVRTNTAFFLLTGLAIMLVVSNLGLTIRFGRETSCWERVRESGPASSGQESDTNLFPKLLLSIASLHFLTASQSSSGTPPSTGTPTTGTPSTGTPTTGTPSTGTPTTGTPSTGTPTAGMPTTGTPSTGMPNSGTPANGMPTSSSSSVFPGTTLGPTGSGGFGDPNAGEKISVRTNTAFFLLTGLAIMLVV